MAFEPNIFVVAKLEAGRLAIMPRPVPGEWIEDEFAGIAKFGIHSVVSLLEPEEADAIGLSQEASQCARNHLSFVAYPIPDRGLPESIGEFARFTSDLHQQIREGANVVVHCRAGIGRASLVAAGVLIHAGVDPQTALAQISKARGLKVPDTEEQRIWLIEQHELIRAF